MNEFMDSLMNVDIETNNDILTDQDIINKIYDGLSKNWIVSYDYRTATPVYMESKKLEIGEKQNIKFLTVLNYCLTAAQELCNYKAESLPGYLGKEVIRHERKGGSCIYNAVLLYNLMIYNKMCDADDLKLVQGFYSHELREDFPFGFGKNHIGMHAWLSYKGSIIDCMLPMQEGMLFDFKDQNMLLGNVPEGLKLCGFEEGYETVKKYTKNIIKESRVGYKKWIKLHDLYSRKWFLESLKECFEGVDKGGSSENSNNTGGSS